MKNTNPGDVHQAAECLMNRGWSASHTAGPRTEL